MLLKASHYGVHPNISGTQSAACVFQHTWTLAPGVRVVVAFS